MKTNFIGYSERGMMDALVFSFMEKPEKLQVFLQKSIGLELAKDDVCDLYLEHSLSEFGTPDLVIIVSHKDSTKDAIFVEAKVKAYVGLENSLTQFMDGEPYNSSNLFYQLYLKNLLFENRDTIATTGYIMDKWAKGKVIQRRIGNNQTVLKFFNKIVQCKCSYYVAIVPELEKDISIKVKTYATSNSRLINFISWNSIVNGTDENGILKAVYWYNEDLIDGHEKDKASNS